MPDERNSPTLPPAPPRVRGILTGLTVATALLALASTAPAALTTGKCLAQKRKAWSTFRKCEGTEQAKAIQGKVPDLAKCTTKLQSTLAKLDARASAAPVTCRYRSNGDGTVTDFATGLMWEKKLDAASVACVVAGSSRCVDRGFNWNDAMGIFLSELNGVTDNAASQSGPLAGYTDWRLPNIVELQTIIDLSIVGCPFAGGVPCIDPIFGPTNAAGYWSSTSEAAFPNSAWVGFLYGSPADGVNKTGLLLYVRAVRNGL